MTGFYYLHIDNETVQGLGTTTTSINGPLYDPFFGPPVTGTGIDLVNVSQKETDSISLFGQIDYDLTDKLTFIAGLRVIFEDKEYELTKNAYYNENDIGIDQNIFHPDGVDVRVPFAEDTSDTLWAGRLQFNYRPNDDWLIYASINRGVKAGDFNSKVFFDLAFPENLPDDAVGYDEEVLTAYEVGFKSTLFDGTTRLNVSFYYYDYDGYQAATFLDFSSLIANEDAKAKGIEFDLTTSPWEGWDFMFGGSFSDPEITNLAVAPDVFRDVRPPFSPTVMLSGLARYSWQALGGTMAAQMNAYYHSSHFHNIRNFDAHKIDAFTVANARLTWDSADEHWQVAFFVNNFADEKYNIQGFALEQICGCSKDTVGKPRWFGGSVRYQF